MDSLMSKAQIFHKRLQEGTVELERNSYLICICTSAAQVSMPENKYAKFHTGCQYVL